MDVFLARTVDRVAKFIGTGIDVCVYNFGRLFKEGAHLAPDKRQKFAEKSCRKKKTLKENYIKANVMFSTILSSILSPYPTHFLKLNNKIKF